MGNKSGLWRVVHERGAVREEWVRKRREQEGSKTRRARVKVAGQAGRTGQAYAGRAEGRLEGEKRREKGACVVWRQEL